MGVAGLWEVLRPAGQVRSLTELAVEDGFNANPRQRGFRIGVDASIWFFHATYGREGENPELRTLFFRCCRLLQSPLLPLFVFDGPNRPAVKRGKRVGGNTHWLTQGMKNIIDAFGFEWRVAPGEAEAELAYLNRVGIIDAVLSDDVDNFLFGATMVIRNPSSTLSGNRAHPVKNAQGKDDGNHVVTYTADAILSDPSVSLSRPGTILIGLLSGGDYIPAGLPGCGQKFATGLARAGFGDSLVKAVRELKGARLDAFLEQWRQDIRNELKSNKSGFLPSKKPTLAASLPDDFPSLPVLLSYADPLTSETTPRKGDRKTPPGVWRNDPDPMRIASLCELYFEWGVKDVIVQRFRTVLWPGIVCRAVRRVVMDEDVCRRRPLNSERYDASQEEDDVSLSPTKRISSALSSLALSSPSKESSAAGTSVSDTTTSQSFILSSLVALSSTYSSSARCMSPSSPTSPTSGTSPLLLEVLSQRTHASTDSTLEYRVLIDPTTLVERAESGVKGLRPPLVGGLFGLDSDDENEEGGTLDQDADESGSDDAAGGIERLETAAGAASKSGAKKRKARREVPTTPLRLWLPACMIRAAVPALVEVYEEKVRAHEDQKGKRGTKGAGGRRARTEVGPTSRTKAKNGVDEEQELVAGPSTMKPSGPKAKSKATRTGGGRGRRKPKQASEAQDDAYEFIDLSAGESPCSSDGEAIKNTKGKGKEKAGQTGATKPKAKAATTNRKAATTQITKPPTSLPPMTKHGASGRVYEEEEERSADTAFPPPLPKSSRPLDLLRARSKPSTAAPNPKPTSKSKLKSRSVPMYEEEESSSSSQPTRPSGSKPNASILTGHPVRQVAQARKRPTYVDVSDTDSDIEVSDIRRRLSGTMASIVTRNEAEDRTEVGDGDVGISANIGKTSMFASKDTSRTMGGVFDLTAKRNGSRSKSTPASSMPTASVPPIRPISVPLGTDTNGPAPLVRSTSKLAHILLPPSLLESKEEEGSEGDELPTFHRGSTTTKKNTTARPVPRPFPMQLTSESPTTPRALRLRERNGTRSADEDGDGDEVEIVDVFTTPRGPSPPRSPTPTPSPIKPPTDQAPTELAKSRQSSAFPISPTQPKFQTDSDPQKKSRQHCRRVSSSSDTSGNDVLKSPRKSAAHSSPRHVTPAHGRASSPTPLASFDSVSRVTNATLWANDEGHVLSDDDRPQPENPGSMQIPIGRKPRMSDTSAIYISSGSEDEGCARAEPDADSSPSDGGAEDQDAHTDRDVDTWADTGMILSAPPSLARAPPIPASDDLVPPFPAIGIANPARTSRFKPARVATSNVDERARRSDRITSTSLGGTTTDEDAVVSPPVRRAPLLIAKQRKRRDNNIIDLTSD